jgi:hypothetical protein
MRHLNKGKRKKAKGKRQKAKIKAEEGSKKIEIFYPFFAFCLLPFAFFGSNFGCFLLQLVFSFINSIQASAL